MVKIKKLKTDTMEKLIGGLMFIFAASAIFIFVNSLKAGILAQDVAILEILIILVLAVLAQTVILLRIYDMHL
ncbi:hypothetical protein HOD20_00125 [archaeon]|nr:hypothetical protein [archaeon]MBT4646960.1 hypothetical protein [archaeon]MBT6821674.1 hypothetical protein [archaeon]MBT7392205.1 hypothetical protein [archaeon]